MSVLACDRAGCENIMCDHHSDEHGYICDTCLSELKGKEYCDIEEFMNTRKDYAPLPCSDWEELIDYTFVHRDDE